jgi:hypothetical protein
MGRVAVFICAAWLLLSQDRAAAKTQMESKATVHTVITTECSPYFDWQILGLVYRSVPSFFASTVTTRPARCIFLYSLSFLLPVLTFWGTKLKSGHLLRSFKRAKQPGSFTRLLSCTDAQLKDYKGLDLVPTHVVPSLTMDPNTEHNDHYSAYNKPGAVLFWLQVPLSRQFTS